MEFILIGLIIHHILGIASREYVVVTQRKTWYDAKAYCANEYGTSLATVVTDQDQRDIMTAIAQAGANYVWTGLNDLSWEGNWVWDDGTPCRNNDRECINGDEDTPPQWGINEPNDYQGREDCAWIQTTTNTANGRISWWNDARCDSWTAFACNVDSCELTLYWGGRELCCRGEGSGNSAAQNGLSNIDVVEPNYFANAQQNGIGVNVYLLGLGIGSVIVNCIFITMYCYNKHERKSKGYYDVVHMESESNIESLK